MQKVKKFVDPEKLPEKYKLAHSKIFGSHFVAAKDLKPGEVILRESVCAVGPADSNKNYFCFACMRPLSDVFALNRRYCCTSCNVAIFCSSVCQDKKIHHTTFECDAFRRNEKLSSFDKLASIMQVLLTLRVWLLQKGDGASWKRVLEIEAHLEERRDTEVWKDREINVIEILRSFRLVPEEANNEPELLQRLCGILDVNSLRLEPTRTQANRGLEDTQLCGLYLDTAIMPHNCTPNTHFTIDDKLQLTLYAAVPIKSEDTISVNHALRSLMGSDERREYLRDCQYFECVCSRCSDPKELGSNLSTLVCPNCKNGFVTNKNPLRRYVYDDNESWHCEKCKCYLSGELVKRNLCLTKTLIDQTEMNIKCMEELLKKLTCSYHTNHYIVLLVKYKLLKLYKIAYDRLNPDIMLMKRMAEIRREIIGVLDIISPGISKGKGIFLWEQYSNLVRVADHDYYAKKIGIRKWVECIEEAGTHIKRSLSMLLLQPPDSPEGLVAKQALEDFKGLREFVALVKASSQYASIDI